MATYIILSLGKRGRGRKGNRVKGKGREGESFEENGERTGEER